MTAQSNAKSYISRILSFLMALIVTVNIVTPTALAATYRQKSVTSNSTQLARMTNFRVTSGKGVAYALGWKKTVVTIRNTGKYPVTVWEKNAAGFQFWKGTLNPGQTWNLSMSGSAKTSTLYFQRGRGNTNISVSVNAGSVS